MICVWIQYIRYRDGETNTWIYTIKGSDNPTSQLLPTTNNN